jgi:hypothetical protein
MSKVYGNTRGLGHSLNNRSPRPEAERACYFGDAQPEGVAWHKASSMKAHEMLNEGPMKACYHQRRSIIPDKEAELPPRRWEGNSVLYKTHSL